VKVGVLGFQGGVYEHIYMLKTLAEKYKLPIEPLIVKKKDKLRELNAVIIPGGESTTISVLAKKFGVLDELKKLINEGLPVMGTCAGAILLAKKVSDRVVGEVSQETLLSMNIEVVRNYFGRQRESFEVDLDIQGVGEKFRAIFIRSPAITGYWGRAKVLAEFENVAVVAEEDNKLAFVFHPELTNDLRAHKYFVESFVLR